MTDLITEEDFVIEELSKQAYEFILADKKVKVMNCSSVHCVKLSQRLSERRPFGVAWFFDGLTKEFVFTLASKESGMDVLEIASKFNGSGDSRLSGFRLKLDEMEKLFDITGIGN